MIGDDLAHRRNGVGTPHADGADALRAIGEGDRAVGGHVLAEPVVVAATVERTGDDPEVVGAEALDGEVAAEATVRGEQRGVHAAAHRHVDVVDAHVLQEVAGAGPLEVELVERGEVDHAHALAHLQVLGVGDGAPPAAVPLVGARLAGLGELRHQRGVALVPLRALPATGIEEHRTEGFLTGVERAAAHAALAAPLLARVHDAVGLVEVLVAAGVDVPLGLLVRVEAADVAAVRVAHVRVAVGHPLGDELGDAGAFLDPHRGRAPQVAYLDGLAEHRVGVGCEAEQAIDGVPDLGVAEHLHQVDGLLELRVEVVVGEGQFGGAERRFLVRGDVVGAHQDGAVGVAAHLHRAGRLALVAERVHVADDREGQLLVGLLEDVDGADIGHLVHGRGERDGGAGHGSDARAPHTAGDDDVLGLDAALVGDDGLDLRQAVGHVFGLEREHLGVGEHLQCALLLSLLTHPRPRGQRVDHRDAGRVVAAEEDVFVDEGHHLFDLGRCDEASIDAPCLRRGHPALELLHALRFAGHLDTAAGVVHPVVDVLVLAVDREERHLLVVVGREDEVRRVAGGATGVGQRAFVDEHHVGPAESTQMADQAVADDAGTDDHHLRVGGDDLAADFAHHCSRRDRCGGLSPHLD